MKETFLNGLTSLVACRIFCSLLPLALSQILEKIKPAKTTTSHSLSPVLLLLYLFSFSVMTLNMSNLFTILLISCTHMLIISMPNLQRYIYKWKKHLISGLETVSL